MEPARDDRATPLDRAAWLSLRVVVVILGIVAALWVAARLRLVILPVAVALLLAAPLRPVAARLERVLGRSGGAVVAVLGLVALVVGTLGLAGRALADDADDLSQALSEGVDDVERWIAEGPLGVDRDRIEELRSQIGGGTPAVVGGLANGAVVAGEVAAGLVLALVLTVFVLRDGDVAVEALARRSGPRRAARLRLGAAAAWLALRRYLLGAAILGALEAVVIGTTVALVGSALAVPVALFTFLAAFVPIVGAVVAGIVAVLASLVSGGPEAAVIVAIVCIVVQQLDGDVLAPLIYGRATKLHPAAVLLAITTGTAIAGLPGAVLAVPLTTVCLAVARATDDESVTAEVRGPSETVRKTEQRAAG